MSQWSDAFCYNKYMFCYLQSYGFLFLGAHLLRWKRLLCRDGTGSWSISLSSRTGWRRPWIGSFLKLPTCIWSYSKTLSISEPGIVCTDSCCPFLRRKRPACINQQVLQSFTCINNLTTKRNDWMASTTKLTLSLSQFIHLASANFLPETNMWLHCPARFW